VKYADKAVLLGKEKTVFQGMTDRFIEIERWYRMEIDVEKPR
jgi:hypothetical protein